LGGALGFQLEPVAPPATRAAGRRPRGRGRLPKGAGPNLATPLQLNI